MNRKPSSSALSLVGGTETPAIETDRPTSPADAAARDHKIKAPKNLNRRAAGIYRRVVRELVDRMKWSDGLFQDSMAAYAAAVDRMLTAEEQMAATGGSVQTTPNGYLQVSGWYTVFLRERAAVIAIANEFGLTLDSYRGVENTQLDLFAGGKPAADKAKNPFSDM